VSVLIWILLMTVPSGLISLVGVVYFLVNEKILDKLIFFMVSFAAKRSFDL